MLFPIITKTTRNQFSPTLNLLSPYPTIQNQKNQTLSTKRWNSEHQTTFYIPPLRQVYSTPRLTLKSPSFSLNPTKSNSYHAPKTKPTHRSRPFRARTLLYTRGAISISRAAGACLATAAMCIYIYIHEKIQR